MRDCSVASPNMPVPQRAIGRGSRAPPPLRHHCDGGGPWAPAKARPFPFPLVGRGRSRDVLGLSLHKRYCSKPNGATLRPHSSTPESPGTNEQGPAHRAFVLETLSGVPAHIPRKGSGSGKMAGKMPAGRRRRSPTG